MAWSPLQLVEKFKMLRDPIPTGSTDFMRYRNLSKIAAETHPFAPEISPRSEILAQQELSKYLKTVANPLFKTHGPEFYAMESNDYTVPDEKNFTLYAHHDNSQAGPMSSNSPTTMPASRFCITESSTAQRSRKQISPVSRNVEGRIQLLYDKHKKKMEKIEHQRTEAKRNVLNGCTFKPALIGNKSYNDLSRSRYLQNNYVFLSIFA